MGSRTLRWTGTQTHHSMVNPMYRSMGSPTYRWKEIPTHHLTGSPTYRWKASPKFRWKVILILRSTVKSVTYSIQRMSNCHRHRQQDPASQ
ncbi:Hypothetical protein PHPALM_17875 [Phytophthora palmivora]|uniref:Uncharacterized protein n=1 Tax=Phytophthora palmivora TaxID=4796 RepID=A0A2P4XL42_9STRA|nr:Hypothetical protein PHPALM_17875 [Phytophthora palmivora]